MKKKISFIITSLVRSGAERVTFLLAKKCYELGYDVEIVMLLYHDIEFEIPEGIKVVDLAGNTNSRIKRIFFWLNSLKKYFKTRNPDVVVSFIARINVLTLLTARKKNRRIIVSERNDPRYDRNFITRIFVNLLYPKADCVVFQTKEVSKLFKKSIRKKGIVISNPINIDKFAEIDKYDKDLIVFAGRYSHQKNIETIINAAEIVKDKYPSLRFEMYGTGPQHDELEELIKEKELSKTVLLNSNVPNINEIMRKSRFLVMSSLYEGMSNSLLEASYSGVPCITTPVLGSSVIKEGENGYFFNFKDYKTLADIIIDSFENNDKYINLRKRTNEIAKNIEHQNVFDVWMSVINK